MPGITYRTVRRGITILIWMVAFVGFASTAEAKQPVLWETCQFGPAAGSCKIPRGLATDPATGHIYVADQNNSRINEFTAWGEFVKAWGWGVDDGSAELQSCTTASGCQPGLSGSGPGQLAGEGVQGLATDSKGNVYAVDLKNLRVQKFNREGEFVWMIGGDVNRTKVEAAAPEAERNFCPVDPGDVCQAGTEGTGQGQFASWPAGSYIAVGPGDELYVADKGRIQEYTADGVFVKETGLPEDKRVGALAADRVSGDVYFSYYNGIELTFDEANHNVFRLDPGTGAILDTVEVPIPRALAVGPDGSLYVFDESAFGNKENDPAHNHITRVLQFSPSGDLVEIVAANSGEGTADEFETSTGLATGSACFKDAYDLYLSNSTENSFVKAYGPPPDNLTGKGEACAPPEVAPEIVNQYAISVGLDSATLGAAINPHFWGDTQFFVEWGVGKCSEGGCTVITPGQPLGGGQVDRPVASSGIELTGLEPGTTYHFRFVASSSGGGPTVGGESSFTTFRASGITPCPLNEAFRTGASAALPDCRAYEMVSPVDKEGGDIVGGGGDEIASGLPLLQSSLTGDAFTYSSYRAFADPQSAPAVSQYLASRDPGLGWESEAISPPQEGAPLVSGLGFADKRFKAFSPDLSVGWNETLTEPVLGPGGLAGYPNIYRRDNVTGTYEGCTSAEPIEAEGVKNSPELLGVSADQLHGAFRLKAKLTPEASKVVDQLYLCSFEGGIASLDLVSVLPNGMTSVSANNTVGSATQDHLSPNLSLYYSWLHNGVSEDGSRVFWSLSPSIGDVGPLYVRVNATQEQSTFSGGKCNKLFKACTYAISAPDAARFWGATPSGSQALFVVEAGAQSGNLYLYDVDKAIAGEEPRTLIAGKTEGVLAASEDLSRVYFLSREAIGGEGSAGDPNLYLYEAGASEFIGTLSEVDANERDVQSPVSTVPIFHLAHATDDGATLVFSSDSPELAEQTAGFDNTDLSSGEPAGEVYRFGVDEGLVCISCDPSGALPFKAERIGAGKVFKYLAAAPPSWTSSLYESNALSADGSRLYFESFVPLALRDTNQKADVYQWEAAGTGDCSETSYTYVEASGGCLDLISSGQSPWDSKFMDASASGNDVFFTTAESLVSQDPGSIDAYDARVGGGVPPPPAPRSDCKEDCQAPTAPPTDPAPTSSQFHGAGNVQESNPPKRCRKGTHKVRRKGRVVCVKNKRHHKKHKQSQSRRAAR